MGSGRAAQFLLGSWSIIARCCRKAFQILSIGNTSRLSHLPKLAGYLRLFLQFNGNLRYIQKHVPFYPVPYSLPQGFTTRYRLNQYGKSYCPSVTGLNDMFTNSAYIGHWTIYDIVVNTDNHHLFVDTSTFMKTFNYLSKMGLNGETNPFYRRLGTSRSLDESQRPVEPPLCLGLVYSQGEKEWRSVGKEWTRSSYYRYVFRSTDQYSTPLWVRSAKHVDKLFVEWLRNKLDVTFDPSVWDQALEASQEQFRQERRRISKQLETLERLMKNQIVSLDTLDDPDMIRAVQQRYADAKAESTRLEEQLIALENEQTRIAGIQELQRNWTVVLTSWETLSYDQKRSVLIAFADRIVMFPLKNDGIEIEIYGRIVRYRGQAAKRFTYQPMRAVETYEQFVRRLGDAPLPMRLHATTWMPHFPYRTWRSIQERILLVAGKGVKVRRKRTLGVNEPSPSTCPTPMKSAGRCWRETSSSTTAKARAFASRRTSTTPTKKCASRWTPSARSSRTAVGKLTARTALLSPNRLCPRPNQNGTPR